MTSTIGSATSSASSTMLQKWQENIFKKKNANGDDSTTASELNRSSQSGSASSDDLLNQLDTNGDDATGLLESDATIAKMSQRLQSQGPPPPPPEESSGANTTSSTGSGSDSSDVKSLLQSLGTALQSGNTTDANTALESLKKIASSNSDSSGSNPFLKDLESIGSALSSGDTSSAQSILASVQQKIQNPPPPPPPPSEGASSTGDTAATASNSGSSEIKSLIKNLNAALQSGNSDDANAALTSLEKLMSSNRSGSDVNSMNGDLKNLFTALKSYIQQSSSDQDSSSGGSRTSSTQYA